MAVNCPWRVAVHPGRSNYGMFQQGGNKALLAVAVLLSCFIAVDLFSKWWFYIV
jgi:hypothetical protein